MRFYFVGIKGTGMAALAEILHDLGHDVKGSDIEKYVFTEEGLKERGIEILPFNPDQIEPGMIVIGGLAFSPDHPEIEKAMKSDENEFYWYNEYLGKFMNDYDSICVAGCHGKSTTTGMVASVLAENGPSGFLIGDGHGHVEKEAEHFVLESCEFKRHFLAYHPDYALITNIELDHADYYKDLADYISAFQSFALQIKKHAIIWGDDPYLNELHYPVPVSRYGLEEGNDYQAVNIEYNDKGSEFDVMKHGENLGHVHIKETGKPFVLDALGVFALSDVMGISTDLIIKGLKEFKGINRRFVIEEVKDSILVDDYAHHPTAVKLMIESCRLRWPDKKICAIYKPDRYSRLQEFLDDFAEALNMADASFVIDFDANAKPEDETITVTINDLLERLNNGKLITGDSQGAKVLKKEAPSVFLFMSSKNVYFLKDDLKDLLLKD